MAFAADTAAEELGGSHLRTALLALDLERRGERRGAHWTTMAELGTAVGAVRGKVDFELEEVALREPTLKAERDEVSEGLPPLLLDPVALRLRPCAHHSHCSPEAPVSMEHDLATDLADDGRSLHGRT